MFEEDAVDNGDANTVEDSTEKLNRLEKDFTSYQQRDSERAAEMRALKEQNAALLQTLANQGQRQPVIQEEEIPVPNDVRNYAQRAIKKNQEEFVGRLAPVLNNVLETQDKQEARRLPGYAENEDKIEAYVQEQRKLGVNFSRSQAYAIKKGMGELTEGTEMKVIVQKTQPAQTGPHGKGAVEKTTEKGRPVLQSTGVPATKSLRRPTKDTIAKLNKLREKCQDEIL